MICDRKMDGKLLPAEGTPPGRKATLKTVAEHTGFAVTTVSRALADDPKIAERTRRIVAEAAQQLGYVPDRAAQRLRTGRTKVITVLMDPNHEFIGFSDILLSGLMQTLRGTGYSVTLTPDFPDQDRVATIQNILHNNLADGIILSRTECFDDRVRLLLERDFPFISHGRTEFTTPHAFVDFDNEAFARAAVERLVARCCRRIGIVLPRPQYTFAQHLQFGFLSAARTAGVDHEVIDGIYLDMAPSEIAARLLDRFRGSAPPDGLICVGEVVALAATSAVIDAGLQPGHDVELLIKEASPTSQLLRPRMDTIFEDIRQTGAALGDLLLRRIAGKDPAKLQHLLAPDTSFALAPAV